MWPTWNDWHLGTSGSELASNTDAISGNSRVVKASNVMTNNSHVSYMEGLMGPSWCDDSQPISTADHC